MIQWPPIKAWTSINFVEGYKHFVAINYGGQDLDRWINLVSVIDGNIRLKIYWKDANNESKWIQGWIDLAKKDSIKITDYSLTSNFCCLHPSQDSGLKIPSNSDIIRDWE